MISKQKRLEFYQTIFNDKKLCPMFLAGLISERDLQFEENREVLLTMSKLILENFEKISFPDKKTKEAVKKFFSNVPEILKNQTNAIE